jgi:hypothetical protein
LAPCSTSWPLSKKIWVTTPATCVVTSTPCEAISVPIEVSCSPHFSTLAASAVTVAAGGFICDRNERIICGLNTNWK